MRGDDERTTRPEPCFEPGCWHDKASHHEGRHDCLCANCKCRLFVGEALAKIRAELRGR